MTNGEQPDAGLNRLPRHVAFIMDGNGRWAKARGLPRTAGHIEGAKRTYEIIRESKRLGIEYVTVFAFSSENNSRDPREIAALMALMIDYIDKNIDDLVGEGARIVFIGDTAALGERERAAIAKAMDRTRGNKKFLLQIAFNYGSRQEIVHAARALAEKAARGDIDARAVTAADFEAQLWTAGAPDVDLVIRTSGEMRVSNFLLYQSAYAEYVFENAYWPDFDAARYRAALAEYAARDRRFGGAK